MSDFRDARAVAADRPTGQGVRQLVFSHVKTGLLFLSLAIGGIYLFLRSNRAITSVGLIVLVAVGIAVLCWVEELSGRAEKRVDRAIPWRQGAGSEEGVGGLLEALPEGYCVFHHFETQKGRTDHIVVGPKGILTIDTKGHAGVVTQFRGTLLLDGNPFEKDFIKDAWTRSYVVRDLLAERGVCTLRPKPVIVFTDAEVRLKECVRGVHIVGIEDLQAFLEGLSVWMSDRLAKSITACLWSAQDR